MIPKSSHRYLKVVMRGQKRAIWRPRVPIFGQDDAQTTMFDGRSQP